MGSTERSGIAILASGSGSTAEAFIHATQDGRIAADVGLVICNNPPNKAGVYGRIARLNKIYDLDIKTAYISGLTHPGGNTGRGQTLEESEAICRRLYTHNIAHVALMGYMKVIRGDLMDEYGWQPSMHPYQARMSNTHPGPLPETTDTFGIYASRRVLEYKMPETRHTVHLVAADVDCGPILAAHPITVHDTDTDQSLFARVQDIEKATLPYVLGNFLIKQGEYQANVRV